MRKDNICRETQTHECIRQMCINCLSKYYYLLFNLSASVILLLLNKLFPWFSTELAEWLGACVRVLKWRIDWKFLYWIFIEKILMLKFILFSLSWMHNFQASPSRSVSFQYMLYFSIGNKKSAIKCTSIQFPNIQCTRVDGYGVMVYVCIVSVIRFIALNHRRSTSPIHSLSKSYIIQNGYFPFSIQYAEILQHINSSFYDCFSY